MTATTAPSTRVMQLPALSAAAVVLAALSMAAGFHGGPRLALAAVLGALAGIALYQAGFGFASGWRQLIVERRGAGLRAHALLFGVVVAAAYPLFAIGPQLGLSIGGFVFPFGLSAAVGATLFGIGMQLGGGCGSGTLYTVGGGSVRMLVVLAAFILGSLVATAHVPALEHLPSLPAVSLIEVLGLAPALAVGLGFAAALHVGATVLERRSHGRIDPPAPAGGGPPAAWGKGVGALALAAVCLATLLVVERPWGITSAFALWGAKLALALGVPVDGWTYWQRDAATLAAPVFADATSVMDFGLMLGALGAAAAAGRFAPRLALSGKDVATAIAGGLLMGYGARLSYGCNIGALLGGITSSSLHGFLWFPFAFAGTVIGVRLRHRLSM
jgi:uncharacterized membrane protein YedE/YeeE